MNTFTEAKIETGTIGTGAFNIFTWEEIKSSWNNISLRFIMSGWAEHRLMQTVAAFQPKREGKKCQSR
jgi:hypothetical protein